MSVPEKRASRGLAKQAADLMIVDLKMLGISELEIAKEVTDRSRTARLSF